jgi:FkbM family methyltransferase
MIIDDIITKKLEDIQLKLILDYGSISDEYQEQEMAVMYIKPDDFVLEIGGNIGRNSCVIAHLLNDSKNLVVFESSHTFAQQLKENRDTNNLNFHIEDCAISKYDLYQKEWNTKPVNEMTDEDYASTCWTKIKTSTWSDIKNKYNNICFNTLVADCEGALYYILRDEPTFLENFKKIIIENDFQDYNHKLYVDEEFKKLNFKRVYVKALSDMHMLIFDKVREFFYEVWVKQE